MSKFVKGIILAIGTSVLLAGCGNSAKSDSAQSNDNKKTVAVAQKTDIKASDEKKEAATETEQNKDSAKENSTTNSSEQGSATAETNNTEASTNNSNDHNQVAETSSEQNNNSNTEDSSANNQSSDQVSVNSSAETTSEDNDVKVTTDDTEVVNIDHSVKFGQIAKTSKFDITVVNAEIKDSINIGGVDMKATQGEFVVIELNLKNNTNGTVQYGPENFILLDKNILNCDGNSKVITEKLNQQEVNVNKNSEFKEPHVDFSASESKKAYIVFDIPSGVTLDNIKLATNDLDSQTSYRLK